MSRAGRRNAGRAAGRKGGTAQRWNVPAAADLRVPGLLLLALFSALSPFRLCAQTLAAGRVVRPDGPDSVPVPDVRVVLHRVGQLEQGPVDSTAADRGGRFRFRFRADTASIYLLSARYRGIEYFSTPVHTNPARPDTAIPLVVYDTSSRVPVALTARHLVIPRPGEDGTREVLDLVVLSNPGQRARVAPDSLGASWSGPLPEGSEGLEVGESDVSPDAVRRQADSLVVSAPIAPGEKQLVLQYHLPPGRRELRLSAEEGATRINLLVEEAGARVSGPLAAADSQEIQGRSFRRWTGTGGPGSVIRIELPGPPGSPAGWLAGLVAVLAAGLALATWRLVLHRPAPVPARSAPRDPAVLLEAIAALDARYGGFESETTPDEWSAYLARRAALKAALEAGLAGRDGSR